jgi:hypothetical protein
VSVGVAMSEVTALLDHYDAGKLSRPELVRRLAGLDYLPFKTSGQEVDGSPDFPQTGTLEEVEAATLAERDRRRVRGRRHGRPYPTASASTGSER